MNEKELRRRLNNIEKGIYFSSIDGIFVGIFILGISLSILFGLEKNGFLLFIFGVTLLFWVFAIIKNKISERIGAILFLTFFGTLYILTRVVDSLKLVGDNIIANIILIVLIFVISIKLIKPIEKYLKRFYWSRDIS